MIVGGFDSKSKLGGGKASGGTVTDSGGDVVARSGAQCLAHNGEDCTAVAGIAIPEQTLLVATASGGGVVRVQAYADSVSCWNSRANTTSQETRVRRRWRKPAMGTV